MISEQYQSDTAKSVEAARSGMSQSIAADIQQTIAMAVQSGATADVIACESLSQSLMAQSGKIAENKLASSTVLGIRIQKEGRTGIAYSQSWLESDRHTMVRMALNNSLYAKLDATQGIQTQAMQAYFPDCSKQYIAADVSLEEKEELTLKLESEAFQYDSRVRVVPYNQFSNWDSARYIANSAGVFCFERARAYSCYTYVLMEEEGKKADSAQMSLALTFSQLDWKYCITKAIEEASYLLQAKTLSSGAYDVIFTIDTLSSLFSAFDLMFSGFAAKNKTNPMRNKVGEKIASDKLSIYDLPRYSKSIHASFFDAEGGIPQDLLIMDQGTLTTLFHNSETGKYFSTPSNARGGRTPTSALHTTSNTTLIQPSTTGSSDIRSGSFIEIQDLQGLRPGCDTISGDFSLSCSGKRYLNHQVCQSFKHLTIAGNFYQMLQQIETVGSDIKMSTSKDFFAPDIRFSSLTIAGD